MSDAPLPFVRRMVRAAPGTPLELASYEELLMEMKQRRPTAAVLGVAYPTNVPGMEHSGKIDLALIVGGDNEVIDQLCFVLAQKAGTCMDLGGGWDL